METIHQLRKKAVQLNKSGQTTSKRYPQANQMRKNSGAPRNGNNNNTGNEKQNKNNARYTPKEFCNKMVPEVRESHIEASKKGRPDQQSYGNHYDGKGAANDQQDQQRNQMMGCTTQEDNENNDGNKTINKNIIRTMKTTSFYGFQPK